MQGWDNGKVVEGEEASENSVLITHLSVNLELLLKKQKLQVHQYYND
jgi:hypothetical protein